MVCENSGVLLIALRLVTDPYNNIKMRVFDVRLWAQCGRKGRFGIDRPDAGGSKHLWNVGSIYQTTRRNKPENPHLQTHSRENLKSYVELLLS